MKDIDIFSRNLDQLEYEEFRDFILDILRSNPKFAKPQRYSWNSPYDMFAEQPGDTGLTSLAVFKIRRGNLITPDYIQDIGKFWTDKDWEGAHLYLITDGTLTEEAKRLAKEYSITVWDIYSLYGLNEQLTSRNEAEAVTFIPEQTREQYLILALTQISNGRKEWGSYQQLSGEIFTHVFSPPLAAPRFEHSDLDGKNRRDMIFENTNEHPFWKMIRDIYQGYYIVVDAKNSGELLDKRPVIDIAHYLKPYGCGMFGILLTRIGASEAARHAIKEQWIGNNKMIIILNDTDLMEILKLKEASGKPEEIIRAKIADFRMSL